MGEEKVPAVYKAIVEVQTVLAKEGIEKNKKNVQQGYAFRGIDDVYSALAPALASAGLCFLPRVVSRTCDERASKSGGVLFSVAVTMEFDLVAAIDGSAHTICTIGEAMDSADKATNKAMSAAYKYAAIQAFCIPVEGEADADATTHEPAAKSKPATPKPAPPTAKTTQAPAEPLGPPPAPGADAFAGTIRAVIMKSGKSADKTAEDGTTIPGKPWAKYGITIGDGDAPPTFGTFDKKMGEFAIAHKGEAVFFSFKQAVNPQYNDLTGIELQPQREPGQDNESPF